MAILQRRPHFQVRDDEVFFLNSTRPLPSPTGPAIELFRRLRDDGPIDDVSQLDERSVDELRSRGLADLIDPIDDDSRTPILVIEPHSDDAALSIGGTLWKQRHEAEFTIATLASRSNYTSSFQTGREFFDRVEVTDLRRHEGETFAAYIGATYVTVDLPEATLRYDDSDWDEEYFQDHVVSVAMNNNRRASSAELERWATAVAPLLQDHRYEEIWLPLGAGTHSDHDLARNAVLLALMSDPSIAERVRLRVYNDVPYGEDFPDHAGQVLDALSDAAQVEESSVDITECFDEKMSMLGVFASQFKPDHIADGVIRSATSESSPGRKVERMWLLSSLPDELDLTSLYFGQPDAVRQSESVQGWLDDGESVRHLRVLALAASGNWKLDERMLKAAFPNASICVYASPITQAEFARKKSADVDLVVVGRGTLPWILLAAKLAVTRPAHNLFLAGSRTKEALRMKRMWPLSRTLVVQNMDQLTVGDVELDSTRA